MPYPEWWFTKDLSVMDVVPGPQDQIIYPEYSVLPTMARLQVSLEFQADVYQLPATSDADQAVIRLDFNTDHTVDVSYETGGTAFFPWYIGYGDDALIGSADATQNPLGLPQTASLGTFAPGDEIVLVVFRPASFAKFFSGPAWRNPDGYRHVRFLDWVGAATGVVGKAHSF